MCRKHVTKSDFAIQNCKIWLLQNVIPSPPRIGAFGKYLASLSKHLQQDVKRESLGPGASFRTTVARKRLHILYLLNDLLHHTKYHGQNSSPFSTFSASLQPFIVDLVQSAASSHTRRVRNRLHELLNVWEEQAFYSKDYVHKLREAASATSGQEVPKDESAETKPSVLSIGTKDIPFVMPATHGDLAMPYYDLPAGNLMPHIMPNSSAAIRPDQVRALQFVAGPADKGLVRAVEDFMKEVDQFDSTGQGDDEGIIAETDDLGQVSYRDGSGEGVDGKSYYGWSHAFCEKMKKRRNGEDEDEPTRGRGYSLSRSPSRSPRKRRRHSESTSSRSNSRSRSPRPRGQNESAQPFRGDKQAQQFSNDRRQRSRSSSYSPHVPISVPSAPPLYNGFRQSDYVTHSDSPPMQQHPSVPLNMPPQVPFQPPIGPNGLPLPPPPPPPNYTGPWPPPNLSFPIGLPFPPQPSFPPRNSWFAGNQRGGA